MLLPIVKPDQTMTTVYENIDEDQTSTKWWWANFNVIFRNSVKKLKYKRYNYIIQGGNTAQSQYRSNFLPLILSFPSATSLRKIKSNYAKIIFRKVLRCFTSSKITYLTFFVQSCLRGERKSISKHWGTVTRICRESKDRTGISYSIYPIYTQIQEPNSEKFQKGNNTISINWTSYQSEDNSMIEFMSIVFR